MAMPKTIDELKKWYQDTGFPPESETRFFIGVDYPKRRAFGIYRDGDDLIVYKNKNNGERVIRYQGKDEAYAVKELYLRLLDEVDNQRIHGHDAVPGLDTCMARNDAADEAKGDQNKADSNVPSYYEELHQQISYDPDSSHHSSQDNSSTTKAQIQFFIWIIILLIALCNKCTNQTSSSGGSHRSSYSDSYDAGDSDSGGWDSGDSDFGSDW